jgi:hypothetical protein
LLMMEKWKLDIKFQWNDSEDKTAASTDEFRKLQNQKQTTSLNVFGDSINLFDLDFIHYYNF